MNELTVYNNELTLWDNEHNAIEPFKNAIAIRKDEVERTIDKATDRLISDAGIIEEYKKTHSEVQYILDLKPEIKQAIQNGEIKLDEHGGEIFAQIRNANGQFGEKLPVKAVGGAIDPMMLSMALQMKSMEEKLDNIVDLLGLIEEDVVDVLAGQQSDRIALYYSGYNQYCESRCIKDPNLRALLTSQAIKTLSDANAQEMEVISHDIKYLIDKEYKKEEKQHREETIKRKIQRVNTCFEFIHRASSLKAQIYYECGEMDGMLDVMEQYGQFLNELINPNADILAELDIKEKTLIGGKWEQRKSLIEKISELRPQIEESKALYLECKEA